MPVIHTPRKQWQVCQDQGETVRKVLAGSDHERLHPFDSGCDASSRQGRDQDYVHQEASSIKNTTREGRSSYESKSPCKASTSSAERTHKSKEPLAWFVNLDKKPLSSLCDDQSSSEVRMVKSNSSRSLTSPLRVRSLRSYQRIHQSRKDNPPLPHPSQRQPHPTLSPSKSINPTQPPCIPSVNQPRSMSARRLLDIPAGLTASSSSQSQHQPQPQPPIRKRSINHHSGSLDLTHPGFIRHHLLALLLDAEGHRQKRQQEAEAANERLKAADNLCREIRNNIISHQRKSKDGAGSFGSRGEIDNKIKIAPTVHHNPIYDSESTFGADSDLDWSLIDHHHRQGRLLGHYTSKPMLIIRHDKSTVP